MSDVQVVPVSIVEHVVGQQRWHFEHVGIHDGTTVTILHSHRCKDSGIDLRECVFSKALANGCSGSFWNTGGRPVLLEVKRGLLAPGQQLPRAYIPTTR